MQRYLDGVRGRWWWGVPLSVVVGLGVGGCASSSAGDGVEGAVWAGEGVVSVARSGAGVFADGATRGYYASEGTLAFERFAFSRNDERVVSRVPSALLATGQWPVPARPAERRIRLEDFDQD